MKKCKCTEHVRSVGDPLGSAREDLSFASYELIGYFDHYQSCTFTWIRQIGRVQELEEEAWLAHGTDDAASVVLPRC